MARNAPSEITDDLSQLEAQASAVLDPEALGYIVASAGDSATARALAPGRTHFSVGAAASSGA